MFSKRKKIAANSAPSICFVATVPFALNMFLAELIRALAAQGWKVTLITNLNAGSIAPALRECAEVISLDIRRPITLPADARALLWLYGFFRQRAFTIVHTITPKAGLLAMLAAMLSRVPIRIHLFTGQVWVTHQGPMRWLLKTMDKALACCATALLADSPSQREFLIAQSIVKAHRIEVLGPGSVCGTDTDRFRPNALERERVRAELGIAQDALCYLYLGRRHREKGLLELADAFRQVAALYPDAYLLLVGPDENNLTAQILSLAGEAQSRLRFIDMTLAPERYMAASDVLCLPSYREGFGQVLIEAAAVGLPGIGSDIYGITDAIVHAETGLLVAAHDTAGLCEAMKLLAADPLLRQRMAEAGRKRAIALFSCAPFVQKWLEYYARQLNARG